MEMVKVVSAQGGIRRRRLAAPFLAAVAVSLALVAGMTRAEAGEFDAARHFKGKTIRLVVDFKPGGGTDLQARYFAANWGKFIPGHPRITVTNLFPDPAGRNFTWKSAPDGLTLSFLGSVGIGDELVDSSAHFQTDKFTQIGSHAKRDVVLIARGTVPYNSIPEARGSKTPLMLADSIGSVEDLSGKVLAAGMLALWFDVPMHIASVARSGSADALIMLERGDINAYIAGSHWYSLPTLRPGWFAKGYVKPIADLGHPDAPSIPNDEISMPIPNAFTWLNDEQKALWRGIYLPDVLSGKTISGPPGIPPAIAKALRDSYGEAVSDPTFAKGLEKLQGQPVALIRGEKLQQLVAEATKAFKEQLPRYNEIRQQVYDKVMR
jgi:tripartite-type tricarboxylate transporter receptor subunit TctC